MTKELINGESLEQYLWRLGENRESLGLSWDDVADLINRSFKEETEYVSESAYRKKYQAAKLFYDEVFNKDEFKNPDVQNKLRELERVKMQLRDERTAYNAQNRNAARLDENFKYLSDKLQEIGRKEFNIKSNDVINIFNISENEMIVCLSDLHIGTQYYSAFGRYDSQIAYERLEEFLNKILDIGHRHKVRTVHVAVLGDIINGIIHPSVQLSNRENLIDQIKLSAELIASFVSSLAPHFDYVYVTGVSGNHSRLIQDKDATQKDERADKLVLWIVQQMLSHIDNVGVASETVDTTIATIEVNGKNYCLVHGDYDKATDAGIGKLVTMLGYIPYAILSGHKHSLFYREMNGIKFIQAGSLCGGGGDYETTCRLTGKPNQTVLVCNGEGEIDAIYNCELK